MISTTWNSAFVLFVANWSPSDTFLISAVTVSALLNVHTMFHSPFITLSATPFGTIRVVVVGSQNQKSALEFVFIFALTLNLAWSGTLGTL